MRLKSENKIYHYCKLSTAIELILPRRELILAQLNKTNDPRENKSFVFAATYDRESEFIDLKTNNQVVSNKLREGCKIICFSHDSSPFFGYEYSKMWAHYGDNHKGICIEINKDKFLEENSSIIKPELLKEIKYFSFNPKEMQEDHRIVNYREIKNIGIEKYLKEQFRMEHLDYLYFTKDKDWESERETRLLYFSKSKTDEYCSIKNSINHIYLGVDFNQNYLTAIINLCPEITLSELNYEEVRLTATELQLSK